MKIKRYKLTDWQILLVGILVGMIIAVIALNIINLFQFQKNEEDDETILEQNEDLLEDFSPDPANSSQSAGQLENDPELINF